MDIKDFGTEHKYLSSVGLTLSLDERVNLELAILKLYEQEDFGEVKFWGKISGVTKDYYITMAVNYEGHQGFPHKRMFWCNEQTWLFAELPQSAHAEFSETINNIFSGEHDRILIEFPKDDENPTKDFTELDRLAHVVYSIENENSVVPRGAFRLTHGKEIRRNREFPGLDAEAFTSLEHYHHFRTPESQEKLEIVARGEGVETGDFLDSLDKDSPIGTWSLQLDSSKTIQVLRSLLWPGYYAYHVLGTSEFGGVYIGDGVKNKDLAFMLQANF